MNIKLIIIIGFSYLYGFFEIFMNLRQRRSSTVTSSGDKGSLWLLYILITIGYIFSFSIGATKIGRINHWDTFFAIGFILIAIGLVIRIQSILTLRKQFTYSVAKIENHQLIERGLYKWIRHPGYLGQLIIFTGIPVSFSNWVAVILMMTPVLIGYIYRINVEERFMTEQMGQKYIDYQKRTNRLIPMIW
jgi:protein-S-isoprenylcysteine O-methyltransferase Ste14